MAEFHYFAKLSFLFFEEHRNTLLGDFVTQDFILLQVNSIESGFDYIVI